jgi:hypothetical protein
MVEIPDKKLIFGTLSSVSEAEIITEMMGHLEFDESNNKKQPPEVEEEHASDDQ